MLLLHGQQVIPLSKHVKEFCLKQGNLKETAVFQQLVYARWAWKELFRLSIWEIKNVVVDVDCEDHTIKLPVDCERLMNIYVLDRERKLQPLTCDPAISTVEINCIQPNCSCQNCNGQDSLCAAAEAGISYTTETIYIQGNPYTQETWTRYAGNGAIQQQQSIPTLNAADNTVFYTTTISTLCNVEVTDKGCIKSTPENMELLRSYCGCDVFPASRCGVAGTWYRDGLIPQPYNYYGYWNVNAADPSIIHIFRFDNGINYNQQSPERNAINKVIVSYQTNGETAGEEILIPEYAQFAIDMGIMFQQSTYNRKAPIAEKQYAKEQWLAAKQLVNKHLNPIRLEDLAKLQTQIRRW
jgi:hypothetical protein